MLFWLLRHHFLLAQLLFLSLIHSNSAIVICHRFIFLASSLVLASGLLFAWKSYYYYYFFLWASSKNAALKGEMHSQRLLFGWWWWGGAAPLSSLCFTMTIIPAISPHAHHGAACLGNGMLFPGQVCAASVPHHNSFMVIPTVSLHEDSLIFCSKWKWSIWLWRRRARQIEWCHPFIVSESTWRNRLGYYCWVIM